MCKLYEGDGYLITAQLLPEGAAGTISFSSDNEAVAKVDSKGNITAVSALGERSAKAVITAAASGKIWASCTVTVLASDVLEGDTPIAGDSTDGIWVASQSLKDSFDYDGTKHTQPDLRVYFGKKLLLEKTDYTLSYKNNVSAATSDSDKAPQVTITMKGNYRGSKTCRYNIEKVDISDNTKVSEPGQCTVIFNKKVQKPVPELYFAGKKLTYKKDFTLEYPDDDYVNPGKDLTIKVTGIGNFTGSRDLKLRIVPGNTSLGKATVTVKPSDPSFKKIFFKGYVDPLDIAVTVKIGGKVLDAENYEVTSLPQKAGKGVVTIGATEKGKENGYYGYKSVNITTYADRAMKDVLVSGITDTEYDFERILAYGGIMQNAVLSFENEVLTEGTDYAVTYSGNSKVGTAKITYKGLGRYSGSQVKTFRINPCVKGIQIDYEKEMSFTKGGVTPNVAVTDAGKHELEPKKDYVVTVLNKSNLRPGTLQFKVVGKGSYKGYESPVCEINVKGGDLGKAAMILTDKAYTTKKNGWKSAVKILDSNGKALSAGKDYEKNLSYSFEGMGEKTVPELRDTVYVTAIGKNDYEGTSITRSYHIYMTGISKLTVVVDEQTYTGRNIEPVAGKDIHVYASSKDAKAGINEIPVADYCVTGYSSNVNPGTGKVTIQGLGKYGGTRVCSFKITKRKY